MAHQSIQWGTTTLILDNDAFREGFFAARAWYVRDIYGEKGRPPEQPERAVQLHTEEMLRLVVMPDEQGVYHFDEMGIENLPEYLGCLVGYLSAPLVSDEAMQDYNQQTQQNDLRSVVVL